MTIANTNTSSTYNGNGSTREWNLGFAYDETLSDLSIRVTHADASHEEITTNYSYYNGVVTYPTIESGLDPLPSGDKITISRVTPLTQEINLTQQGPLDAETLESGYDKLTMEVQELSHTVGDVIPSINLVADNIPVIQSVAANEANINSVAGNASNINSVASNATNINTTASNMSAIIAAPTEASNAATSASNAQKWAEGTDEEVQALGGTHSAEGWAGAAGEIATNKVSKTGDTMSGRLDINRTSTHMRMITSEVDAATTPSANAYGNYIDLVDDNIVALGRLACESGAGGYNGILLQAFDGTNANSKAMGVRILKDGTDGYAYAPTPDANANGVEIATAAWVRGLLSEGGVSGTGWFQQWVRFPNGVQICWGNTDAGITTVTFPMPFKDATVSIIQGDLYSTRTDRITYDEKRIESWSATGFTYHNGIIQRAYVALGFWK